MKIINWNPLRDIERSFAGFPSALNSFASEEKESDTNRVWLPPTDITENKNAYVITAELPGIKQTNINVSLDENILCISAEHFSEQEKDEKTYLTIERIQGKFSRRFILPDNIVGDKIESSYKDGLLTVTLPKQEVQVKETKKIEVKTS